MQVIPKCIQNLKILIHLHKNTNFLDHNKMSLELGLGCFVWELLMYLFIEGLVLCYCYLWKLVILLGFQQTWVPNMCEYTME
jgi:hypothetical protein